MEINEEIVEYITKSCKGVKESSHFLSLFTDNYEKEPYCIIQMGYAVLLDKPIYLIVQEGRKIPENLKRLAKKIVYCDISDKASISKAAEQISQAIKDSEEGKE